MKRIISLILSVVFVIASCFAAADISVSEVNAATGFTNWSGYSSYLKGAGSETNPFLISSPKDLAYFRKQVATDGGTITYYSGNDTSTAALTKEAYTAYYKLTEDIYYNDPNGEEWKSWTASVQPTNGGGSVHTWSTPGMNDNSKGQFDGNFDGDGHTIYGLYIIQSSDNCVGFLGLTKKATIENLTLAYGYIKGNNCVAAFVGRAMMGSNIINCTSRMRVVGNLAVGGIVGGNPKTGADAGADIDVKEETTMPNFTVFGCTNRNAVKGTKWAGGIVGLITGGISRVSIDSCKNTGKITAETTGSGGILGGTMTVDGYGHNYIYNCRNSGEIVGGSSYYAGGIAGCGRATDISYCVNTGTVNASSTQYVGGITGGSFTADKLANSKIYYCTNKGAITGGVYTGGIIGSAVSYTVRLCANMGAVTGTTGVGGIAGLAGKETDLRNAVVSDDINTGAVSSSTGDSKVAGLVGIAVCEGTASSNRRVTLRRSINYASVSTGRAICYSDSTVKDSDGKKYIYTLNADTCFGMSGINTNFDGGTKVSSFVSQTVLDALNSNKAGTWMYGTPVPVLTGLDTDMQGYAEASALFSSTVLTASSPAGISVSATVDTSSAYYAGISSYSPVYGFLAIKSDSVEEDRELTIEKSGVRTITGTLSGSAASGSFNTLSSSEYNVVYKFRPYVKLTINGIAVYVYGKCAAASYYTSSGAASVSSLNLTAITKCETSVYVLVGGTHTIEYEIDSPSPGYSVAFTSSDETVATVASGKIKGVKAGTAAITVKMMGAWGTKRHTVNVKVLDDITTAVYANDYAAQDNVLRYHTNEIAHVRNNTAKSDGYCLTYNGTVCLIDGGHKNNRSLLYLKSLREKFLSEGYDSGRLSLDDYHRYLLSNNCKLKIVSLWTHYHNDHLSSLRYYISKDKMIEVSFLAAATNPSNKSADGYDGYMTWYNETLAAVKTNSPNVTVLSVPFGSSKVRYFGSADARSTSSDAAHPLKLTMCGSADWSKNSSVSGDATAWENCSSVWYLFEYSGIKLLFTGDTYPDDVGTTYSYGSLSGRTAVDYMLSTYKSIIGKDIYFLECNHHSRNAFVENLFTATEPVITVAGISYGLDTALLGAKAVVTSDFYLAGDGQILFAISSSGSVSVEQGSPSYSKNADGHAIRNYISRRNLDYVNSRQAIPETVSAESVVLSSSSLTLEQGGSASLYATVLPGTATSKIINWTVSDANVLSFDGDTVTAKAPGTALLTVKSGSASAVCSITVKGSDLSLTASAVSSGKYTLANGYMIGIAPGMDSFSLKELFNGSVTVNNASGTEIGSGDPVFTGYSITNGWDTAYAVIMLDVDGNGKRTVSDYLKTKRAASGTYVLTGAYKTAADTDGDGTITLSDVLNVKLYFKRLKQY